MAIRVRRQHRAILDNNGLSEVEIITCTGNFNDHYDPRNRVLRLSRDVYMGTAIASDAIAAHEVGHDLSMNEIMLR